MGKLQQVRRAYTYLSISQVEKVTLFFVWVSAVYAQRQSFIYEIILKFQCALIQQFYRIGLLRNG